MKKLVYLILILTLPLIAYFQYKKYTKFNPPTQYDYVLNDSIDYNYYDPTVVQDYLENVYKIGSFARSKWSNDRIDVRFPEEGKLDSEQAVILYNQMISATRYLEGNLKYSATLKNAGFDNSEIKRIIEDGLSPENFELIVNDDFMNLSKGSSGHMVWEVQKILIQNGYDIPHDGTFGEETENALKQFQTESGVFASGTIDKKTLKILLKQ